MRHRHAEEHSPHLFASPSPPSSISFPLPCSAFPISSLLPSHTRTQTHTRFPHVCLLSKTIFSSYTFPAHICPVSAGTEAPSNDCAHSQCALDGCVYSWLCLQLPLPPSTASRWLISTRVAPTRRRWHVAPLCSDACWARVCPSPGAHARELVVLGSMALKENERPKERTRM